MAEVHPIISGADRYSISVDLIIREPLGIMKVRVFDQFGVDILSRDLGCETSAVVHTDFFARGRCPFQVEVTACGGGPVTVTSPLFSPDPRADVPMPCDPLMCEENEICRERQNQVLLQRNLIDRMCAIMARYRARERELMMMMTIYYAIAFVLFALAIGFSSVPYFAVLAIVFVAAGAAALGLALYYNYLLNETRKARQQQEREMEEARIRFDDLVREVMANCCAGCIDVDLTQPRCM